MVVRIMRRHNLVFLLFGLAVPAVHCASPSSTSSSSKADSKGSAGSETSSVTIQQAEPVPWAPPPPSWPIEAWERQPRGGGLPPEPIVYTSNSAKYPPSIASGQFTPAEEAHAFPPQNSPYFPQLSPSSTLRGTHAAIDIPPSYPAGSMISGQVLPAAGAIVPVNGITSVQ